MAFRHPAAACLELVPCRPRKWEHVAYPWGDILGLGGSLWGLRDTSVGNTEGLVPLWLSLAEASYRVTPETWEGVRGTRKHCRWCVQAESRQEQPGPLCWQGHRGGPQGR